MCVVDEDVAEPRVSQVVLRVRRRERAVRAPPARHAGGPVGVADGRAADADEVRAHAQAQA